MNISVPSDLKRLAHIFFENKEKLYIVGGYVRNKLLGIPDKYNKDIDICSSVTPEKVIKILQETEFEVNIMNEETGVLEIIGKNRYEHATFRREKYAFSGVHIPNNVEFIKDIKEDAKRRDFCCNAVYYDIVNEEIIDILNGVNDIRNKLIRTTRDPKDVFSEDAERILRMVRLSCTLNFNIDSETYNEAKNNAYKVKFLSVNRIRKEFSRIILSDCKYDFLTGVKFAHRKGLDLLFDLDVIKYILPYLNEIKNSGITDKKGNLLIEHILNVFKYSHKNVRLSALLFYAGKFKSYILYNNFNYFEDFLNIEVEKALGNEGLGFNKKIIERVKKVVNGVNFNKIGLETQKNIKLFIVENFNEIELICLLKDAIRFDKSNFRRKSLIAVKIRKVLEKIKVSKTPINVLMLNIKGSDLIKNIPNIKINKISEILKILLNKCIIRPALNSKDKLLYLAKKYVNKNRGDYID